MERKNSSTLWLENDLRNIYTKLGKTSPHRRKSEGFSVFILVIVFLLGVVLGLQWRTEQEQSESLQGVIYPTAVKVVTKNPL